MALLSSQRCRRCHHASAADNHVEEDEAVEWSSPSSLRPPICRCRVNSSPHLCYNDNAVQPRSILRGFRGAFLSAGGHCGELQNQGKESEPSTYLLIPSYVRSLDREQFDEFWMGGCQIWTKKS